MSTFRHPNEAFELPFYFNDTYFGSPTDIYNDFTPVPGDELFTTLNIETFDSDDIKSFRIPVYGSAEKADYFFKKGYFDIFWQRLLRLRERFPKALLIFEYQINVLNLESFPEFLKILTQLQKPYSLEFGARYIPSYLQIRPAFKKTQEHIQRALDLIKDQNWDIENFLNLTSPIQSANETKHGLSAFYYSLLSRGSKQLTLETFPDSQELIIKSAQSFLEISPGSIYQARQTANPVVSNEDEFLTYIGSDPEKRKLVDRFLSVKESVPCEHTDLEMFKVGLDILNIPSDQRGVIVEAGVFKGGGTARLSLFCKATSRRLYAFDSFEGLPSHDEASPHALYPKGVYKGSLNEVKANLGKLGEAEIVTLVPGWFENTLADFNGPVALAYLDVDLASSTKTCLKYLWPLLISGGSVYCHDSHLKPVADLIYDPSFWEKELSSPMPKIISVSGNNRMVKILKD